MAKIAAWKEHMYDCFCQYEHNLAHAGVESDGTEEVIPF
jgi:hypothetical protein